MRDKRLSRRDFLRKTSIGAVGIPLSFSALTSAPGSAGILSAADNNPAIMGGTPTRTQGWPDWPVWDQSTDEERVLSVIRSGVWSRSDTVSEFEKKYAETIGTKRCLATTNGTHALLIALRVMDIGAGDEVLVTPYTFIATIAVILMNNAIPVFVDVDPESFQIDPDKIEEKITPNTRAILPVHILGLPADMPRINAIAKKHDLVVVEDACQAWLAEINHQKVGTFGDLGCFSFQNSKHLPIGEGGAIVGNDDEVMDRCFSFHNFGRPYGSMTTGVSGQYVMVGSKSRMTEYQAAIGLAQLKRLEQQTRKRNENAAYLRSMLSEIPGILPYRLYDGVTQAAFHLFPFRYKKEQFNGLPRDTFLRALRDEGIPGSSGYTPLNTMPYLEDAFTSKNFRKIYSADRLDYQKYLEENQCPENDQMCQEAVWFSQRMLLGSKSDMDDIATAIQKIHRHSGDIASRV